MAKKLNKEQFATLRTVYEMTHLGGSVALDVFEWRRREALRKRGLLKYHGRKRARWDRTFYDTTAAGERALGV